MEDLLEELKYKLRKGEKIILEDIYKLQEENEKNNKLWLQDLELIRKMNDRIKELEK